MEDLKNICENGEEFWDVSMYIYSTSLYINIHSVFHVIVCDVYYIYMYA